MKLNMHITSLNDSGDHVVVECQGSSERDADWQPMRTMRLACPVHVGKRYSIGQRFIVTVTPGRKP